jgi:hypothetical protein
LTPLSANGDIGVLDDIRSTAKQEKQKERIDMGKLQTLCKSAIVFVTWSGFPALATVYNSDGSSTNIQYIHDTQAQNGDTITIPTGTFTWSMSVNISKAIELQGQGGGRIIGDTKSQVAIGTGLKTFVTTRAIAGISAGQTLRVAKMLNYANVGRENYMEGTVVSYNGTTLTLNVTRIGGSGTYKFWYIATNPLTTIVGGKFSVRQSPSGNTEINGIHFLTSTSNTLRPIDIDGVTQSLPKTLVHDCWFQNGTGGGDACIELSTNQAVIWSCSFDGANYLNVTALKQVYQGDEQSWRTNSTMGMADTNGATNLYVEDCDFRGYLNLCDWDSSSRVVMRHDLFDNSGLGSHGADTSPIGLRHIEIYDNELVFDNFGDCDGSVTANQNWFFWMRGGTGVITDNVLPAISSCAWGNKANIYLSVLNINRSGGCYGCWATYPAPHQIGQGYGPGAVFHAWTCNQIGDASYYIYAEPLYVWNNTGSGGNNVGLNSEADACGHNQHVADYIQAGRDYIIGAKPGYQKFTYPHPLRGGAPSPTPSPSPSSSPSPTATATATATPRPTPTPATPTPTPTSPPSPTPTATPRPTPTATATPTATPRPTPTPTATPTPSQIRLNARGYLVNGRRRADLSWSGSTARRIDIYRNGAVIVTTNNDGFYTDLIGGRPPGIFTYQVCDTRTNHCSNQARVTF